MKHCKNCGKVVHDTYCAHCGQKIRLERITYTYLTHEVFHFFTHIEHGFLFTSWKLITVPGKTICGFIEGQRQKYQSPISYFIVWTTIYILLLYGLEKTFGENSVINYRNYFGPTATTRYAISHLSMVLAFVIPFQALYLFIVVTRIKYNYFETVVAAIYSLGTIILFQFLFALLALVIYGITDKAIELQLSDAFKVGYLSWFVFDFLKYFPVKGKLIRAVIILVFSFGTFTLWRLYGLPLLFHHENG